MQEFSFEPAVIKSIRHYKRSVALRKVLTFVPLVIGYALTIWLISYIMPKAPPKAQPVLGENLRIAVGLGFLLLLGYAMLKFLDWCRFSKWIRKYLVQDPWCFEKWNRFNVALSSVCIASGMQPMHILVFEPEALLKVNYMDSEGSSFTRGSVSSRIELFYPFQQIRPLKLKRNETVIAVTSSILAAPLDREGTEALMASAVGHIMIDDVSRPPGISSRLALNVLAFFLYVLISTALMMAHEVFKADIELLVGLGSLAAIAYSFGIIRVEEYSHSRKRRCEQAILADSIGVTITKNPAAMRKVIMQEYKLHCDMFGMPYEYIGKKTPWWKRNYFVKFRKLTNERVKNVDAIALGNWPLYELSDTRGKEQELANR